MTLDPYVKSPLDWKPVVKDKWLLFDADAIILILEYGAEGLLDDLSALGATSLYIHPILLELMNTKELFKRTQRLQLLDEKFEVHPFRDVHIEHARRVQLSLPLDCQPSIADLYMAGALATYPHKKILIITGNHKDFPHPLFTREGYLVLQKDDETRILSIIGIDTRRLVDKKS